ncbi:MAG TPA: prepilin-type N-terminal cleavage/methylation domain-containing protein [bacterium]|nr:prepilin-type N-terminal cleavage/methylation domain-containing protein [bacterium]
MKPRGLALIELLVVLAVAGLVTGLAVRTGPLGGRLALRAAAAELVGQLRGAQARALGEREPDRAHGLEFPAAGDRYVLFVRSGGVRATVRTHHLPPQVRITYARFGGSPRMVMFTGVSLLGAPSGGGTVTLASGAARLCVRVLPATGRVRVAAAGCP